MAKAKKEDVEEIKEAAETTVEITQGENSNGTDQEDNQAANDAGAEEQQEVAGKATAKAGKRSAKAQRESEAKQAKEARKSDDAEPAEAKPKVQQKPARSRLERRGKNYRKAAEQIDKAKEYTLKEAVTLATKTSPVKFDATVELHVKLGVDPRQADQNIRDVVALPAGTGKTVRIAVLAEGDDVAAAKKAGADIAGTDEIFAQLDKEQASFDILIATPALMARLGKYARFLGPKGLMPNPKSGTVTPDVAKAVNQAKAGRVEYRVDSTGIVHVGIGKVSFGADKLAQNAQALMASIRNAKPASVKGTYLQAIYVTTTMGPSVRVQTSEV